jgi:23S rRNA pseudouridine1911/1915/1917 synthase
VTEHELIAPADAPRLDLLVAQALDLSRNQAATLIAEGRVLVAGRREKASYRAREGELILIEIPAPAGREVLPEDIPLSVAYEDADILVVDKPAGMVVHPAPGNWTGTLVNALKGRGAELAATGADEGREGIVHRLDKETSGLLLVAKTDRAHRALAAEMQARRITRRYAVLSWGHLAEERVTIDRPIARDPRDRKRMAIVNTGRAARTDLTRLARFDSVDLLRAHLFTGRTHQIRVHLASIGHPVVGDDTYGGGGGRKLVGLAPRRHFLHAAWLVFRHPVSGTSIDLRSPLPEDLHRALVVAAGPDVPIAHANPLDFFGFYDAGS